MTHRPPPRITRTLARLLALWWALCGAALAAPFAVVDALSTPDARGQWRPVEETAQATVLVDGQPVPLRVGMELAEGATVRTLEARVRIELGPGERLHVSEGAELQVGERSVTQVLGEVYYRVRDRFTVDYGRVETAVDGTRFSVSGPDPVTVRVTKGQVRVSHEGAPEGSAPYVLRRGDAVTVAQDGTSQGVQPRTLGPGRVTRSLGRTWLLGRPRLQLGLLAGGALAGGGGLTGLRLDAGLALPGRLRLVADLGARTDAAGTLRVPLGLGLRWGPGAWSVGAQVLSTVEDQTLACGGRTLLHVGGVGTLRGELALGRNISLLADLRGGYADAVLAEAAVGIGVGL